MDASDHVYETAPPPKRRIVPTLLSPPRGAQQLPPSTAIAVPVAPASVEGTPPQRATTHAAMPPPAPSMQSEQELVQPQAMQLCSDASNVPKLSPGRRIRVQIPLESGPLTINYSQVGQRCGARLPACSCKVPALRLWHACDDCGWKRLAGTSMCMQPRREYQRLKSNKSLGHNMMTHNLSIRIIYADNLFSCFYEAQFMRDPVWIWPPAAFAAAGAPVTLLFITGLLPSVPPPWLPELPS